MAKKIKKNANKRVNKKARDGRVRPAKWIR